MQSLSVFAILLLCLAAQRSLSQEPPLFEDASSSLAHQHHEEFFDDFERQALLPRRLSQLGPGLSWVNWPGSPREVLLVGSGKGGVLAGFQHDEAGGFKRLNLPGSAAGTRDQTTILAVPSRDGTPSLLIGCANYEDDVSTGACVRVYHIGSGTVEDLVPSQASSIGPLALADFDGDGDLDLFVAGRVVPGHYPEPASSLVFENRDGHFVLDEVNSAQMKNVGLVSGAAWTDLDGDGFPELVLACEWGPIRIFHNDHGHLKPWDPPLTWPANSIDRLHSQPSTLNQARTLNQLTGFWNGVAPGDFDGDGRMDLAVSNWGLNSHYHVRHGHGPRVYYGPWGGSGEIEVLEASFDPQLQRWLPQRDLNTVAKAMPWVRESFRTHHAYTAAGIEAILGEHFKEARMLEVNWLQTTVFLNRGAGFEVVLLPAKAQFSPAFGINVADFDGDGKEDIFLSQNFFALPPQVARNDAGRGLLLKGDGAGGFTAADGSLSGIKVYGEQRGSAVADYDGDGRPDLAVSQNGAETKLFHNVGAKPGLRVKLKGPPGNPTGIGAVIRVGFGEQWGPAREIHAGSGYWSQDSPIQVMALPKVPTRVQALWPGGKKSEATVQKDAHEIEIQQP